MTHHVLSVQLLGGFNIVYDDVPLTGVNAARLQSLLACLILQADTPQSRSHLAFRFWPDTTASQARNNLRQFLYQLRQTLPTPDRFLVADTNTVHWQMDEDQVIDVHRFAQSLKEAEVAEQRGDFQTLRHRLEQAITIYQGDLLPDCYDDWITPERERLCQQCYTGCQKLINLLETEREYVAALQIARHLHRLDPLDEGTYVALIRLCGLTDDWAGAQRIYQKAVDTLRQELGVEPSQSLQATYNRLQRRPRPATRLAPIGSTDIKRLKLVGRQAEWQQLQAVWQRAMQGETHLVLITGEAGIGKSRLAEELFQWATRQGFTTAHAHAYDAEGHLSLAPITDLLRREALHPHLASLDPVWLTEIARLLPQLLSDYPDLSPPEPIAEYGRRQRFFEALTRSIFAAPSPLLLWLDDLQWCDQETLEWLHFLLRFELGHSLLILGTARSDESPPDHPLSILARQLRTKDKITVIELSPLDVAETTRLAAQVRGHTLDDRANIHLYRETEGNPLFIVETVRAGLLQTVPVDSNEPSASPFADSSTLPPRVRAIIVERLAQLSPSARKVIEIGAVIGRSFSLELLLQAGYDDEVTVIDALNELWQRHILHEKEVNSFDFTHDKLREVAYAEISPPQRRLLHRRIAQALETLNAEALDPLSPQIAAHYEQAGLFKQAIPFYQRAGAVAAGVYANENAIRLYNRGLALLEQLPPSRARHVQELDIQLELAKLYRISKGWTSPEEERAIHRAKELSDKVGSFEQRIHSLFGLQTLYVAQARYDKVTSAVVQAEALFRQARRTPPPFADLCLAYVKFFTGHIVHSRELFQKIVVVRDQAHIRNWQAFQGVNYLVYGLTMNAHVLWCLGYPQTALREAQAAVDFARDYAQPFNQALAITCQAMLHAWCANAETFRTTVETAYALTETYKAPYYHSWANILKCFAEAEQQPGAETLAPLRQAILDFTATGARIRLPVYYSLLAQACLKAEQWEAGMEALDLALSEAWQNDEHWWDAEIYRLRGELLRAQGAAPTDVEVPFQRALEIAQAQQSKSHELRATISLARLWQIHARPAEAKQRLTQVYDWFTEGFDTPDLQAAQTLIGQL